MVGYRKIVLKNTVKEWEKALGTLNNKIDIIYSEMITLSQQLKDLEALIKQGKKFNVVGQEGKEDPRS